jgi:hypothetical protein
MGPESQRSGWVLHHALGLAVREIKRLSNRLLASIKSYRVETSYEINPVLLERSRHKAGAWLTKYYCGNTTALSGRTFSTTTSLAWKPVMPLCEGENQHKTTSKWLPLQEDQSIKRGSRTKNQDGHHWHCNLLSKTPLLRTSGK